MEACTFFLPLLLVEGAYINVTVEVVMFSSPGQSHRSCGV